MASNQPHQKGETMKRSYRQYWVTAYGIDPEGYHTSQHWESYATRAKADAEVARLAEGVEECGCRWNHGVVTTVCFDRYGEIRDNWTDEQLEARRAAKFVWGRK